MTPSPRAAELLEQQPAARGEVDGLGLGDHLAAGAAGKADDLRWHHFRARQAEPGVRAGRAALDDVARRLAVQAARQLVVVAAGVQDQTGGAVVTGVRDARVDEELVADDSGHAGQGGALQVCAQLAGQPAGSWLVAELVGIVDAEE